MKNKKLFIILIIATLLVFAFSFALVPFYNVICKTFGINGKTNTTSVENKTVIDNTRTITVEFLATTHKNLPWDFYPLTRKMTLHPGQTEKMYYFAKNNSNKTITAQAVPSITPGNASRYFKKIECFCFRKQTLQAYQPINMPVIFYIAPTLPKNIHEITLSYTLYYAGENQLSFGNNGDSNSGDVGALVPLAY